MVNQSNSKETLREKIIFWLIVAVVGALIFAISDIINVQIFEHKKLYYCKGDKYFLGTNRSWGCFPIIEFFRQPHFYLVLLFGGVIGFILGYVDKNEK
jgi:hypothetical protein